MMVLHHITSIQGFDLSADSLDAWEKIPYNLLNFFFFYMPVPQTVSFLETGVLQNLPYCPETPLELANTGLC